MHTSETILALLERNDEAVKRAIKRLAGEGFGDGPDAGFLADINAKLPLYDDRMTPPQYRRARKALAGYVERLVEAANGRKGEAQKPAAPETPAPSGAAAYKQAKDPDWADMWGMF
ncbi:hypothetical protein [Methylobacterium sp. AMS5]|uniref:hypothetical protein n=1 Tax=Methylobacterium sp. AMS5 TaxID=925818 RepID=UPI00074FA36A|nr:hypothetical protein [Methylobacterium sp. AMS5]AMB48325.1 hypothetical protein Y590_25490 [Methylobacterium sp. AMS5]